MTIVFNLPKKIKIVCEVCLSEFDGNFIEHTVTLTRGIEGHVKTSWQCPKCGSWICMPKVQWDRARNAPKIEQKQLGEYGVY
jgi:hypothetical protein